MIRVITVGRLKDRRVAGLVEDYALRIRALAPFGIVELKDEGPAREAQAMLCVLGSPTGHELVAALDETGDELDSHGFAELLGRHGAIALLVGGPDGLGDAALQRASRRLRLSAMTLPHELARLFLVEQIYRGLTILRNRSYHRD